MNPVLTSILTFTVFCVLTLMLRFCIKNDSDMKDSDKHKGVLKNTMLFAVSFPVVNICLITAYGSVAKILYMAFILLYLMFSAYFDLFYKQIYSRPSIALTAANYIILIMCVFLGADIKIIIYTVTYSFLITVIFRLTKFGKGDIMLLYAYISSLAVLSIDMPAYDYIHIVTGSFVCSLFVYVFYAGVCKIYRLLKKSTEKVYAFAPSVLISALLTIMVFY